MAAANGHASVVGFLVSKGAFVDTEDKKGCTALHLAAMGGHTNVVDELLERGGASLEAANDLGLTAVGCALLFEHPELVEKMQKARNGASEYKCMQGNIQGKGGYSLLHMACLRGSSVESIESMLQNDWTGRRNDDQNLPRSMINNAKNISGAAPLHCAVAGGNIEIVKMLLGRGADAQAVDGQGRYPAEYVSYTSGTDASIRQEMVQLLTINAHKTQNKHTSAKKTPEEEFASLPLGDKKARLAQWVRAAGKDRSELHEMLKGYVAADKIVQIAVDACDIKHELDVHNIYSSLRSDIEFQDDMRDGQIVSIIEALRKDTTEYEYYAAQPRVGSVLRKMKRTHGHLKILGVHKLELDACIIAHGDEDKVKAADETIRERLKKQYQARLDEIHAILDPTARSQDETNHSASQTGMDASTGTTQQKEELYAEQHPIPLKQMLWRNAIMSIIILLVALVFRYWTGQASQSS